MTSRAVTTEAHGLRHVLVTRGPLAVASLVAAVGASLGWPSAFAGLVGWTIPLGAGLGCMVGIALTEVGRRRRPTILWPLAVVALVAYLLAVVNRSLDPGLLVEGLTRGPIDLISVSLPLAGGPSLADASVVLSWIVGTIVGILASGRPPTRLGVVVVVLLEQAAALAVGVASTAGGVIVAIALVMTLLLGAPSTGERLDDQDQRLATRRRIRTALEMLVVAALIGSAALAIPRLGRSQPVALRRPPHPLVLAVDDPIATVLTSQPARDTHPWFRLTLDAPAPRYVAYLVLGGYDGIDWTLTNPRFHPAGEFVPDAARGVTSLVTTVTPLVSGLGPWIPAIGEPAAVAGVPMAYSPGDDMTVVNEPTLPHHGWHLVQALDTNPQLVLSPENATTSGDLSIPLGESADLGHILEGLRSDFSLGPAAPIDELAAIAHGFAYDDRLVPLDTVNQHVDQADTLFADATHAVVVARRATTVQYATVLALIARSMGLPSRLVLGFRIGHQGAVTPPGTYQLGPSNLTAWVEVATGLGTWQIFDPNPTRTGAAQVARFSTAPSGHHGHQPTSTVTPGGSGHAIAPPVRLHLPRPRRPLSRVFELLLLAMVIVLCIMLAPLANDRRLQAKARRRVRQAPSPRHAYALAWRETVALVDRLGINCPPGWTGPEIVQALAAGLGPQVGLATEELRANAEQVLFDPLFEPPSSPLALSRFQDLERALVRAAGIGARYRAGLPAAIRRRLRERTGAATSAAEQEEDRALAGVVVHSSR